MRNLILLSAILALTTTAPLAAKAPPEYAVQTIELAAPLNEDSLEFSGMTWCDDKLVLAPQYPERLSPLNQPSLYFIEKASIIKYLEADSPPPLAARAIELHENDIRERMMFFDGYEAIACDSKTLWFSIEAMNLFGTYQAYVVPAELDLDAALPTLSVRTDQIRYVESQSGMRNKGDEAIVLVDQHLISLHEVNDARMVSVPKGNRVHTLTGVQDQIDFEHLPYRVTDASAADHQGRFWLLNYKYSGDEFAKGSEDSLIEQYGLGKSHQRSYNLERLIEYQIVENQIRRTQRPPVQLLMEGKEGRNWEGLAKLDNRGFLVITDKHPSTLFGFISYPLDEASQARSAPQ